MSDVFIPLHAVLRGARDDNDQASLVRAEPPQCHADLVEEQLDVVDAIGEARRFRASLADALECKLAELLVEISSAILGRELDLAPVDVDAIVKRAIETTNGETLAVRVHPSDANALREPTWRVVEDPSLRPGDAMLETSCGTIDARLGVRLQQLVKELQ